jgi:hypothetical protein
MAVLCTYKDDEFQTLYYYYRALMAQIPFATAKDNILSLFEKNRYFFPRDIFSGAFVALGVWKWFFNVQGQREFCLLAFFFAYVRSRAKFSGEAKPSKRSEKQQDPKKVKLAEFFTVFVRLHGILVSRTRYVSTGVLPFFFAFSSLFLPAFFPFSSLLPSLLLSFLPSSSSLSFFSPKGLFTHQNLSLDIFCSLLQNASEIFLKLFLEGIFPEPVLTQMMIVNILTLHYIFEEEGILLF